MSTGNVPSGSIFVGTDPAAPLEELASELRRMAKAVEEVVSATAESFPDANRRRLATLTGTQFQTRIRDAQRVSAAAGVDDRAAPVLRLAEQVRFALMEFRPEPPPPELTPVEIPGRDVVWGIPQGEPEARQAWDRAFSQSVQLQGRVAGVIRDLDALADSIMGRAFPGAYLPSSTPSAATPSWASPEVVESELRV